MKAYIFIPFALLLGLVLGGWGPRSELRGLKEELQKTKRLLKGAGKQDAGTDVANVTRLLGLSPDDEKAAAEESRTGAGVPEQPAARAEQAAAEQGSAASNVTQVAAEETPEVKRVTETPKRNPQRRTKKTMQEDIDKAVELWQLRSNIARSTFLENGRFSDGDAIDFDVLMEAMNVRLAHTIEEWAKDVEKKEQVGAEEGIRLMNGITEALILTYDAMDEKLPKDWRETGGKGMRLFDFIDPAVAKPIITIEDRMDEIAESLGPSEDGEDKD
jgi:hypothetical protein